MAEGSTAVFISYRRDVGGMLAMALYQHLTSSGIDAFYDIESIRAGQFEPVILGQIAARPYFVLVLTPGTLERCDDPKDWLRRELEQAIATSRVIVPVYTPNFDFGDLQRFLPGDIGATVQGFNGQELSQRWFRVAVQQLVDEFLVPTHVGGAAVSAADQAIVDRVLERARSAPVVTVTQLTAQEYFERAYARPDDDVHGKIADYTEAVRLDSSYADAFYNRGIARRADGDVKGAIADYTEAVRLDSSFADAFYNRGIARRDDGDVKGAIGDFTEAIRLVPNSASVFFYRGLARGADGDVNGAIGDFTEAIRLDPNSANAIYNRGVLRRSQGDPNGAIADLTAAIRLGGGSADAFNNRGLARRANGDLKGAIADFTEAIRLDPDFARAFNNRGMALGAERDFKNAIADFTEAIRLKPDFARAFYYRGVARKAQGDVRGAIADFEQGARLAPDASGFQAQLAKLRNR